jgi:teichuronic acid biosynthesis glycosyltransferase TuaC
MKTSYKVLFVSSSGKTFKLLPFIKSQFESLQPYLKTIDHYRIKGSGIKAYYVAFKELKAVLKEGNYDIVHAHWSYAGILCSFIVNKEKLVISYMGSDLQGIYFTKYNILTLRGFFNILASQYLLLKADSAIVKSKRMLKWIPWYVRKKTTVIPNGVNLSVFSPIPQASARNRLNLDVSKKYILFLGDTNNTNKNFHLLQKALEVLDRKKITYDLVTPYPTPSSDVPYYLAAADVLAFTSKLEGSPNLIKEALAMGCPIVSTDVGDVRERVEGVDGCFIAEFDEHNFADMLIKALEFNNRTSSKKLVDICQENIAVKIISLYHSLTTKD